MTLDLLRWGGDRLRIGPWRGDHRVAYVAPLPSGVPTTTEAVRHSLDVLAQRGFEEVVTAALGPAEARGFLQAGFEVRENLHLLAHDLRAIPAARPHPVRRGRRADRPSALRVDALAFQPFWRLDNDGFEEAMSATPASRFRVIDDEDGLVAYAVSGRAQRRGFLQRLAVDPHHEGAGMGTALVADCLRWLRHRNVERCMVNTQASNERALRLYEHLGFRREPAGLVVLQYRP